MEESLPAGFRFHPTDEELITHYLSRKVLDVDFTAKAIVDIDLNKSEPWDLPAKASMGEKEWYFFNLRDRKYPTGLRTNRATEAGYWKTTGKDKEIYRTGILVGMKKTLVFYKGRAPKGEKSNWVMHEYRLEKKQTLKTTKEEWVVCRIFKKNTTTTTRKPQEQPQYSQTSLESPYEANSSLVNKENGDIELQSQSSANFVDSNHFSHIQLQNNIYLAENININACTGLIDMAATTLPSISSWSTSLLGQGLSPMDSLLLKAFQIRNSYSFL